MKRGTKILLSLAAVSAICLLFPHAPKVKVWREPGQVGISLDRPGRWYQSWTVKSFDGYAWFEGKYQPVVWVKSDAGPGEDTFRAGKYPLPRFEHFSYIDKQKENQP